MTDNTTRITYVDPADAFLAKGEDGGYQRNYKITPRYEDMCISFNLIVRNYPRRRTNTGIFDPEQSPLDGDENGTVQMFSWYKYANEKATDITGGGKNVEWAGGGGERYLTTYYTDISANNYGDYDLSGEQKIVEGLGVESVNISFESWYTPTVAIKFVDIRGSAIWGNEEALHKKNNDLSVENVFGCFMTLPLPKFHLQIKGFLGHPVTFQLTCSSFSGSYNSQTGNFEAVAKFIGYSYSLLTDIPIKYLMYAPECEYFGRDYWNNNKDKKEWRLSGDKVPPTIRDMIGKINGATLSNDGSGVDVADEQDTTEITELSNETEKLQGLLTKYETFISTFTSNECKYVVENKTETGVQQYVCFVETSDDSGANTISAKTMDAYTDFATALKKYDESYPDNAFGKEQTPNEWGETIPSSIHYTQLLRISRSNNTITNVQYCGLPAGTIVSAAYISSNIDFNKGDTKTRKMTFKNAVDLTENIIKPPFNRLLTENVYILDTHTFVTVIETRLTNNENKQREVRKRVSDKYNKSLIQQLGFEPYIGNVFKILMCHLETFINIFHNVEQEIQNQYLTGDRTTAALGLSGLSTTDVIGVQSTKEFGDCLPPWPLVFKNKGDEGNSENEIAWIGDYSPNYEEEKFVLALHHAIDKNAEDSPNLDLSERANIIPMCVDDLLTSGDYAYSALFDKAADFGFLMGSIALRMGKLLGVQLWNMNADQAKKIGRAEAFNFSYTSLNGNEIKTAILDKTDAKGGFQKCVVGVSTCSPDFADYETATQTIDENGNQRTNYSFEQHILGEGHKRDWIMREDGDNYVFDKYPTNGGGCTLPTILRTDFSDYKDNFKYDSDNKKYIPQANKNSDGFVATGWVHNSSVKNMISQINSDKTDNKPSGTDKVYNPAMFSIVKDETSMTLIQNIKEKLSNDTAYKVRGYEFKPSLNDSDILDKLYGKGDECNEVYRSVTLLAKKSDVTDVETCLLNGTSDSFSTDIQNYTGIYAKYTDEKWKHDSKEITQDEIYPYAFVLNNNTSLFGHPFYYLQNDRLTSTSSSNDIDDVKKVKALLLLHTFEFKPREMYFSKENQSMVDYCPYAYLLFLGGLLWWSTRQTSTIDVVAYGINFVDKYKRVGVGKTFIQKASNGVDPYFRIIGIGESMTYNTYSFSEYFGGGTNWKPDEYICNVLIDEFEKFADTELPIQFELKQKGEHPLMKYTTMSDISNQANTKLKTINITREATQTFVNEKFANWAGKYIAIQPSANGLWLVNDPTNANIHTFLNLLFTKVMIVKGRNKVVKKNSDSNTPITIPKSIADAYLTGFGEALSEIAEAKISADADTPADANGDTVANDRRQNCISMYLYLKNVWDKWIVTSKRTEYDVKHFYDKHFFFIDSFYRKIDDKLPINCRLLADVLTSSADDKSLYSVIDTLVGKHHCIFCAVPDFLAFTGHAGAGDDKKIKEMFTPIPFNRKDPIDTQNKFVVIYTTPPSKVNPMDNNYRQDGFNVIDESGIFNPPDVFKADSTGGDASLFGYQVPCFGVSVSTQYNHVFKSVNVNMNNPTMTDSAIKMYENIANMNHENRQFEYVGQDLYPIYANYAYECEVEMLGCAQIAPLMYFQLLNIPMWRGTYMVFNVQHTMTAGNMTTKFKGTRMSRHAVPFVDTLYAFHGDANSVSSPSSSSGYTYGGTTSDGAVLQQSYTKVDNPKDYWGDSHYCLTTSDRNIIHQDLPKLFNSLVAEILLLDENKDKGNGRGKWNIRCTCARSGRSGGNHARGNAIDIHIVRYDDNGNVTSVMGNSSSSYKHGDTPEILTVLDIIANNHRDITGRVLLEYPDHSTLLRGNGLLFSMLHIESQGFLPHFQVCVMAQDNVLCKGQSSNYCSVYHSDSNRTINSSYLKNLPATLKIIAAKEWNGRKANFKQTFACYSVFSDGVLDEYFSNTTLTNVNNGPAGGGTFKMLTREQILSEFAPAPTYYSNTGEPHRGVKTYDTRRLTIEPKVAYSQLGTVTDFPLITISKQYAESRTHMNLNTYGGKENNPCNIENPKGGVGYIGRGVRHAKYNSVVNGVASTFILWLRNGSRYTNKSLIEMNNGFQGYYSKDETLNYKSLRVVWITNNANRLGVNPWDRLNMKDKNTAFWLLSIIATQETGSQISRSDMESAWAIAQRVIGS